MLPFSLEEKPHFQFNKGCLTTYNRSEKFQFSLLTSLAFVPVEEVHHLWDTVIEPALDRMSSDLTPEIEDYVDYFTKTFIGKIGCNGLRAAPRIPTKFWVQYDSVLNQVPSTNNAAEAWNHAWNISRPQPQACGV